jgi:ubiquinone/menaquinone biosynthesis C-methylase UbiE
MLLNKLEFALMNNPVRALIQGQIEARVLAHLGGTIDNGRALEVGCGRGIGIQAILETFHAQHVDAFDLDVRMVIRARQRTLKYGDRVRLWVGDASAIAAPSETYDAVFDYGIIHHVPDWRTALSEVHRILKPGGRFYGEEMLAGFITHPIARRLFDHPQKDRFRMPVWLAGMEDSGLSVTHHGSVGGIFGWFVATKPSGIAI